MFGIKKLSAELEKSRIFWERRMIEAENIRDEMVEKLDRAKYIEEKVDENVERLNKMINELKGLVSQVRAHAKK